MTTAKTFKLYCPTCLRHHWMTQRRCPTCNVYEQAWPASNQVAHDCYYYSRRKLWVACPRCKENRQP